MPIGRRIHEGTIDRVTYTLPNGPDLWLDKPQNRLLHREAQKARVHVRTERGRTIWEYPPDEYRAVFEDFPTTCDSQRVPPSAEIPTEWWTHWRSTGQQFWTMLPERLVEWPVGRFIEYGHLVERHGRWVRRTIQQTPNSRARMVERSETQRNAHREIMDAMRRMAEGARRQREAIAAEHERRVQQSDYALGEIQWSEGDTTGAARMRVEAHVRGAQFDATLVDDPATEDELHAAEELTERLQQERSMPRHGEQLSFISDQRPQAEFARVALGLIESVSEAPNPNFTENVERLGIVLPVALVKVPHDPASIHYIVADGRRRIAAARRLGWTEVPAMIFPEGTPARYAAAVTLSTNFQRRANPLSELEAIEELMRHGATEADVAEALRLSVVAVRARLRLAGLRPYMREHLRVGAISQGAALMIARLAPGQQQAISRSLTAGEQWTREGVRRVYFPNEDPAQEHVPLAEAVIGGREITVRGWPQIMTMLEVIQNAVPTPDATDQSATAAEIMDIAQHLSELIDMIQPFTEADVEQAMAH